MDTVELCLIGAGYISAPSAEASKGQTRGVNGSSTTDAEKQWAADELGRKKAAEERRVREKGRALEDGYPWNEKGGYATDAAGERITLAADGKWVYADI